MEVSKLKLFTFVLPERFNSQTPRNIIAELQALPDGDWDCVVLDMSDTTFIDSSGIGVLVFLYKEFTAKSKSLILKKPQRNIYSLFVETGIDKLFDMELSSGIKRAEAPLTNLDVQLEIGEETIGDVAVISLSGVMNYPAGSSMFQKNMFLTLASSCKVLLDFKDLAFFDSLSVGSVLRVSRLLTDNNGEMRICGANHVVSNVFESLGIDALVPFYDTREEALADW
jgi:anti-anti-sigma factor